MPLTFGRVVHPPFRDRLIPDSANRSWDDLGPRKPVGAVKSLQHRALGALRRALASALDAAEA